MKQRAAPAKGFTLMELLAVMAIVGILVGMTVGGLSRTTQGTAMQGAARITRSVLQMARRSAEEEGALARVIFVPDDPSQVRMEIARDAATIPFTVAEGSRVLAGRNRYAALAGVSVVEGGTVRSCAEFKGNGTVSFDQGADLVPVRGFSLAFDFWPEPERMGGDLASFGRLFVFRLGEDGALSATLECEGQGSLIEVATEKAVVAPGTWARVELHFDGIEVRIRAHGVVEAKKAVGDENDPIRYLAEPEPEDRLRLGSKGLQGFMDEVRYVTLEEAEVTDLERGVRFELQGPFEVRFDERGRLDPRLHPEPVSIRIRLEDETQAIEIDKAGVVR